MSNTKTFIHIGLPKTGSTYLQDKIFPIANNLLLIRPPHTQHDPIWNKLQYADPSLYNSQNTIRSFSSLRSSSKIISDEGFSGKWLYGGLTRTEICKRLQLSFPEAKIMMVIRNQYDMIKSLYNQWVKGPRKGTKTIGDFIWYQKIPYDQTGGFTLKNQYYNTNEDYLHLDYLKYFDLIKLYKDHFEEVVVMPFELLQENPNDFVNKVFNYLELNDDFQIGMDKKVNPSLKSDLLARKVIDNRMELLDLNRIEKIVLNRRLVGRIKKKNEVESEQMKAILKDYFTENNEALFRDYPEIEKLYRNKYLFKV